jgi:TrmH family RNA methyltransferase
VSLITSRANPQVKAIRALLRSRRERDRAGVCFVEGERVVAEAVALGLAIETLVVVEERLTSDSARFLVAELRSRGVRTLDLTPEVYESLAEREGPQEIGAVVQIPQDLLADTPATSGKLWLALGEVQHPGNLGTLIRSCDAAGGSGVVLLSQSSDPYHPIAVRGSLGTVFSQRILRATPDEFVAWLREGNCTVVGTSPTGTKDYREVSYKSPCVVLMGGERIGLSDEQKALCTAVVRIPLLGRVDSLNVATSATLVLYEAMRQQEVPLTLESEEGEPSSP